jgi:hypothetical protein
MTKPPRRKIEPLAPPPESFDKVVKAAHARRRRHGVIVTASVAVLALVSGVSFALGSSLSVSQRISAVADSLTDQDTASATPTPTATNQASPKRTAEEQQQKPAPAPAPSKGVAGADTPVPPTVTPNSYLRGRAVDTDGNPVANLLVQPGAADHATFQATGLVAAVTDAAGEFTIACPKAPVLLSTWRLNEAVPSLVVGGDWAATYVGGSETRSVVPACGKTRTTTVVARGATLTGTVRAAGSCPEATFPLWVWLDGDRRTSVRISGLHDGDTFRFSGLPAGTHVMGARGITTPVAVPAGVEVQEDAKFLCPVLPEPSTSSTPDPTESTPSPTETPADTQSPSPTGSGVTPEPTASALAKRS